MARGEALGPGNGALNLSGQVSRPHLEIGAPGRSRTRNLVGRSHLLCPVELRGQGVSGLGPDPWKRVPLLRGLPAEDGPIPVPCWDPLGGRSSVG
jgi:hypothetical protein